MIGMCKRYVRSDRAAVLGRVLRIAAMWLAAAHVLATGPAEASQFNFNTIALTGTDGPLGPGLGPGMTFSVFQLPTINAMSDVAFHANLAEMQPNQGVGDDGVWMAKAKDNPMPLALRGTNGPLGPGLGQAVFASLSGSFLSHSIPVLNDAGKALFFGTLTDSESDVGLWIANGDNPVALALTNTDGPLGPGIGPGQTFSNLLNPALNASGQSVIEGFLIGFGNSSGDVGGIWSVDGDSSTPLALHGTDGPLGPGLSAGLTFDLFARPTLNANGRTVFFATLDGAGISDANNGGIWTVNGGSPVAVVREGNDGVQGPGFGAGVSFTGLSPPNHNDQDQITFSGLLTGTGVDDSNREGIWRLSGSGPAEVIARMGTDGPLGPGLGPGVGFTDVGGPFINANGDVYFVGATTGMLFDETNIGIWIASGGSNTPVMLPGTDGPHGPGLGPGVSFLQLISRREMNAKGDIVFSAILSDTDGDDSNNLGVWAFVDDELRMILRTGDFFDVDPTGNEDLRTVSFIRFTGGSAGQAGLPRSLNDDGLLTLRLSFDDGSSGIFTVQVPEPASATLLAVGVLALRRRRRGQSPGRAGG